MSDQMVDVVVKVNRVIMETDGVVIKVKLYQLNCNDLVASIERHADIVKLLQALYDEDDDLNIRESIKEVFTLEEPEDLRDRSNDSDSD